MCCVIRVYVCMCVSYVLCVWCVCVFGVYVRIVCVVCLMNFVLYDD
jgi:hypothetical protein